MKRSLSLAALAAALAAAPAHAVDLADGKLSLNVFGGWAAGYTDGNTYSVGAHGGQYHNVNYALAVIARPTDNVSLAAQITQEPGGILEEEAEMGVEWAFAEVRLSDLLRIRAGKVKQPLGSYMEIEDVGTLRPLYTLPTAVYGPAEIGAEAYEGVGLTGQGAKGDWTFQYDLYGGELELEVYEPFDVLRPGADPGLIPEEELEILTNMVGGRFSVGSPWGVTLRLSGLARDGETDEGTEALFYVAGASLEVDRGPISVRAEAFRTSEEGAESTNAGYVEAAWRLHPRWTVAARYEASRTEAEDVADDSPLLRHDEVAVGASFWFSPNIVFRASAHGVRGNRFTAPEDGISFVGAPERTLLIVAGTQFSF